MAALLLVTAHAPAEAREEKPRVSIAVVGCDDTLAREAQRIAAIELRAVLVDATPDQVTTHVEATCGAASASLRVLDPMTGKSVERSVALSQAAPTARARLLALAIAELVAASWMELESNPEPKAPPMVPLAPVEEREAARRAVEPRPIEVAAVGDAHLLASRDWLLGGGVRTEIGMSRRFFLRFDAMAHHAELSRATGTIAVTMPSLSSAVGVVFGAGSLRPRASLGARAGYVWMSGVAGGAMTTGGGEQGAWAGPEVAFEVSPLSHARVHPVASLSVGAHLLGVRGTVNGGNDVMATSIWAGLSFGAAAR